MNFVMKPSKKAIMTTIGTLESLDTNCRTASRFR